MDNILLVVQSSSSQFVELSRIARLLRRSSKFNPVILFMNRYATLERDLEICKSEEWEFVLLTAMAQEKESSRQSGRTKTSKIDLLPGALQSTVRFFFDFCFQKKRISLYANQTRAVIRNYRPRLMVFPVTSVAHSTQVLIGVGHKNGIPSVIVPYTFSDAKSTAESLYNSVDHIAQSSFVNRLIGRLYRRWRYEHRGRQILRLSAGSIVAIETSRFRSSHPWLINSEDTCVIAVESQRMLEHYVKRGFSRDRLVVTGALFDDLLAEGLKTDKTGLYQEYELDPHKPLLLCALPPNQFPRECEFKEFDDLLRFWMQSLASLQAWNVLVRPHPRLTKTEIDALRRFGCAITLKDTATLVPKCDLYVASVSATIRWAIACGKPVVNYDVYQYGYQDYSDAGGVLTLDNKKDFIDTLKRLTEDQLYYDQVAAAQRESASHWGQLDGNSSKRILEFFENVISANKGQD